MSLRPLTAAEAAFSDADWAKIHAHLDTLKRQPEQILEYIASRANGIQGIGSAVYQMDPEKLDDEDKLRLTHLRATFPKYNSMLFQHSRRSPCQNKGASFQSVLCHNSISDALVASTPTLTMQDKQTAISKAEATVTSGARVMLFFQPRLASDGKKIVSLHFTQFYWPIDNPERIRFLESYNLQKAGEGPGAANLQTLWGKAGIANLPRDPRSNFEMLWASNPANSKLAVTDITVLGEYPRDKDLLGENVFGISANKPGTLIYPCGRAVWLDVNKTTHQEMDAVYEIGQTARERETQTTFGLHTGPASCVSLAGASLAAALERNDLAALPLDQVVGIFCEKATGAYQSDEPNLSITDFLPGKLHSSIRICAPMDVKAYADNIFKTPEMMFPRDPSRSSYNSQYILFTEPHPDPYFNKVGLLGLEAAEKKLREYANNPDARFTGDDDDGSLERVFRISA
jgi:hypothetical protein